MNERRRRSDEKKVQYRERDAKLEEGKDYCLPAGEKRRYGESAQILREKKNQ